MHPAIERGLATWPDADPAFRDLPGPQAADPRRRRRHLHGRRRGLHARGDGAASTRRSSPACRPPRPSCASDLPFTRWGRGHRGREVLEEWLRHYLPSRRARVTDDLFSQLCHIESEDGERFSDDDVVNHMVFLMMAAHDTSTITLSTMLQFLGQHPEWQERCRAESDALPDRPTLCRARLADLARPGDEGVPAAARPGAGRRAPHGQGRRRRGRAHPGRHLRHRRRAVLPPDARAVDRPRRPSTPSGSRPSGARTRATASPGSPSAAACTSASACSSPAWRSRR